MVALTEALAALGPLPLQVSTTIRGSSSFHTEVEQLTLGVSVGPGNESGVPFRVVGEGCLLGLSLGEDQARIQRVLGNVDPDDGSCSIGAHGAAPLWLTDAGSYSE